MYPKDLLKTISYLQKLPGVGRKSAERFAFKILSWNEAELKQFGELLSNLKETVLHCKDCGCFIEESCNFCKRDPSVLCIIAHAKDAYAIEQTHLFKGIYHVLGSLISPLDDLNPEDLKLDQLIDRAQKLEVKEVIIALDPTLEGDATAFFLKNQLENLGISVTKLALGLPMGTPLEYIDEGTLTQALAGRQRLQ
ncbi:MAG: Recombination protein RecR [Chlamydiia bacterium]|nr:Recombination protein RecR [Chlamydiia bacterium]MCH9615876.1 Recombination protein RecR [Chlamydiia bacterium]MCH9628721.1 Recombination protein RecR [Chlamydiia bacterium]